MKTFPTKDLKDEAIKEEKELHPEPTAAQAEHLKEIQESEVEE